MDESQFIKSIQEGDQQAFRWLVETHQRMVVNTCLGIVHDRDDAEDLAQEVFLEVFRSSANFRGDSRITTWLYRIAVNRSLNFVRNNKRRKFFQSIEDAFAGGRRSGSEISAPHPDQADGAMIARQRAEMLHQAIDQLPENQRIAFTLNKYEDLSYQEIAEVMEMSLSSVESLIHRAKKNLQKKLYDCYKKKCI